MRACMQRQQVVVHSALLAAHSGYYAKKFEAIKHSQRLFADKQPPHPLVLDTGKPGKAIQVHLSLLSQLYLDK